LTIPSLVSVADNLSMKLNECVKGMLLKTKNNELIEVQSVQYNRMTAKILFPLGKAPTSREYGSDLVNFMQVPSPELLAKYEAALTERRARGKGKNQR